MNNKKEKKDTHTHTRMAAAVAAKMENDYKANGCACVYVLNVACLRFPVIASVHNHLIAPLLFVSIYITAPSEKNIA